jgi:nucleoside-diphosphate-sugar epimerase
MATQAKIAIFGANGYIGRHLSRHFLGLGMSVDAFDVQPESKVESVRYETCDICDAAFWERFQPQGYTAIFFLAGLSVLWVFVCKWGVRGILWLTRVFFKSLFIGKEKNR